ncbi:hypothetical protein KA529_00810 [Candidatus Saccharibacteria bacterium]|nr:hypothetical protein [Candidatus Saccharibacteria bacterium]
MAKIKISELTRLKLGFQSVAAILSIPKHLFRALVYSAIILFILQWLFNVEVLWSVATTAPSQLPSVLIEGYFNLFRYGFDLTPFMLVTISAFQGAAFAVLGFIGSHSKSAKNKNRLVLGSSIIGSGCVTCGGSIIAPLIGLFVSNGGAVISQFISDFLLVFAALLALYSLLSMGAKAAVIISTSTKAKK